ncbi:AraC family transcriptional regulator [Bifidobacterium bombi]|uniref:AraC-type transcriptional regulator n=1 Tax=Bifidobacterium bombi DSM 19703 TaxID=1341695 RepID=A0A086BNN5_9BIFI|nr:AraC family transcriptional regulator [Bifidobacterium bombi]KFF30549.1 AraC-type transcriptional regulator [Bifidobacterium bombi DSM 19703]
MENSVWFIQQPIESAQNISFAVCGISRTKPGHSFGPALRTSHIVHIVLGGTGTVRVGEAEYHLHRNDGFVVGPDMAIEYHAAEKNPWTYLWMGFNGTTENDTLSEIGLDPSRTVFHVDEFKPFLSLITECFSYTAGTVRDSLKLNSLAYDFLHLLTEHVITSGGLRKPVSSTDQVIQRAVTYIARHLREGIGPSDVAKGLHVDRSYLSRRFHKVMGTTMRDYIDGIRMEEACDLIAMTSLSVKETARRCGFKSNEQFNRKFKDWTGVTPMEYRRVRVDAHDDLNMDMDILKTLLNR